MSQPAIAVLDDSVVALALAAALGLFLGLEREWSDKKAGIRTFALVSLAAAVFTILESALLLVVGGLFVVVVAVVLGVEGLLQQADSLSLTTSTTLLVAYGVGALVASGLVLEGVSVAVVSSLLLVLRQELHGVADALSREEVRAGTEFAILAFVVYPLLPATERTVTLGDLSVAFRPRVVWLMVVFVAGIGIVNYAIVRLYGSRGIAITGFFGGLASSTAVVGAMLDHVDQRAETADYGIAAVALANASMALRNLAIAVVFTVGAGVLVEPVVPLGAVILGGFLAAWVSADWTASIDVDLDSPFTLRYALGVGALFFVVLLAGGFAEARYGTSGLYVAALLAGLVSSAGASASAVVLYTGGNVTSAEATVAVILATAASIVVKAGLCAFASNREFARGVAAWSVGLLVAAGAATAALVGL
ncbi:MgtC/SapB transporter [Halobacteriales archaeon QS_1_69_70]|nr:MAG: MgtC/SapB transporter [Halobacteriales archaeon QS_1_69_70]